MIQYVEAPQRPAGILPHPTIFLAGGIPGCRDWQGELGRSLQARLDRGTIFNPRRKVFFEQSDLKAKEEQITWEFQNLWAADIISFWFSRPTENPTTLLEFGAHMARRRVSGNRAPAIVLGIDPGYAKERGVRTQTRLLDPGLAIASSIEELSGMIERAALDWAAANPEPRPAS